MVPFLLAAALLQSSLAVETLRPEGGPTVAVHHQRGPLVALRLSAGVPLELPEGTVELLQELARPDAEAAARRFGARLEFRHDPGRAVVAVTGPAAAFDALAAILRRAIGLPDLSVASLRRARARAEDRVLARLEQPGPRIRRLLHHGVYGGPEPRSAAAVLLGPEDIRRARTTLYQPSRVRVVLVGEVPVPIVRSAFAGWSVGGTDGVPAVAPDSGDRARPQAHREWGGIAFPVDGDPALLAVTAELVRRRVQGSALRYGAVETWHEPTPALVLIGAATPGDRVVRATAGISELSVRDSAALPATDVRRYLRRLVAEAAALAGPDAVASARTAVVRRLHMAARTPAGKAEAIGRIMDRRPGADPAGYVAQLEAVELDDARALLDRVLGTPAVIAGPR